jgi:hypothetical protein
MRLHHAEVLIPKADAFRQLAAEKDWLSGKNRRSILAPLVRHPPREWTDIAKRVEKVLGGRELVNVLGVLGKHNRNRATPFLLGPHLSHVIQAVTGRKATVLQRYAGTFTTSPLRQRPWLGWFGKGHSLLLQIECDSTNCWTPLRHYLRSRCL